MNSGKRNLTTVSLSNILPSEERSPLFSRGCSQFSAIEPANRIKKRFFNIITIYREVRVRTRSVETCPKKQTFSVIPWWHPLMVLRRLRKCMAGDPRSNDEAPLNISVRNAPGAALWKDGNMRCLVSSRNQGRRRAPGHCAELTARRFEKEVVKLKEYGTRRPGHSST